MRHIESSPDTLSHLLVIGDENIVQ
jgi:hypothetical protein